jgi:hypothetical protein
MAICDSSCTLEEGAGPSVELVGSRRSPVALRCSVTTFGSDVSLDAGATPRHQPRRRRPDRRPLECHADGGRVRLRWAAAAAAGSFRSAAARLSASSAHHYSIPPRPRSQARAATPPTTNSFEYGAHGVAPRLTVAVLFGKHRRDHRQHGQRQSGCNVVAGSKGLALEHSCDLGLLTTAAEQVAYPSELA